MIKVTVKPDTDHKQLSLHIEEWKVVIRGLNYSMHKLIKASAMNIKAHDDAEARLHFENAQLVQELKSKIESELNIFA